MQPHTFETLASRARWTAGRRNVVKKSVLHQLFVINLSGKRPNDLQLYERIMPSKSVTCLCPKSNSWSCLYLLRHLVCWRLKQRADYESDHGLRWLCAPVPAGRVEYFYREVGTWHTTHSSGIEVFHFANGQTEAHHPEPDSYKEVSAPRVEPQLGASAVALHSPSTRIRRHMLALAE